MTLSVTKSGTGSGTVTANTGTIIWSGNTGTATYNSGTSVTLTATADMGSTFAGWTGCTSASGTTCTVTMTADKSVTATFSSSQAYTTLSLELSSQTILQNATIDASGKLSRLPDIGSDLSGLTITLTITSPSGSTTTKTTTTYDSYGHYTLSGLSGFTQKGTYTIKASFSGNTSLASSESDTESILVGSSAGYAVIIEGKISSEEGLSSHNKTANRIYDILIERGFIDENIYYFNYTSQTGVDATPSKSGVQYAINTWPVSKMNGSAAPLYIIMVDHGNTDTFYLNNETITPSDLNTWLNTLETSLNTTAKSEKRIIIIGSCYSGSFIDTISKSGRVIITSAAADEESYKGPSEPDGIRSGEYFLEEFFKQLDRGYSLKESFEEATSKTETYTREGGSSANTNSPYFDGAVQHPLLDDNGDGTGTNMLSDNSGDGTIAEDLYLGAGTSYDANSANNPADITDITDTTYLSTSQSSVKLWAKANNNSDVDYAWIEIRSPSKTLTSTGGTDQLELDLPKEFMTLNSSTSQWEKTYSSFTESGMYEIYYYVRDAYTYEISPMKRSVVYRNKSGNNTPNSFNLVSPANGSEQKTVLILDWEDTTDPDGDEVTYTVMISKDSTFATVDYKEEEIPQSTTGVGSDANLSDMTTYYWKVQAIDQYGSIRNSSQTWSFITDNTNGLPWMIYGYVTDTNTGSSISSATVTSSTGSSVTTQTNGYYIMSVSTGTTTITVSANGYNSSSFSATISSGSTVSENISLTPSTATFTKSRLIAADFDGDGKSDYGLYDRISGYWYITYSSTGQTTSFAWGGPNYKPVPGDFDGDGKTDYVLYDKTNGYWYITYSSTGESVTSQYGGPQYEPIPGDFDGDGKSDWGLYGKTNGYWYITYSSTLETYSFTWGGPQYDPVICDYDGDGKTDYVLYDRTNGYWYITYSSTGGSYSFAWGGPQYKPISLY